MALNEATGNMFRFITHTWNTIRGECFHKCPYCYMKGIPSGQGATRYDNTAFRDNLKKNISIFVGSSNDLFADNISSEWIQKTIYYCSGFDNHYLFLTKNPARYQEFNFPKQNNLFDQLFADESKYRFGTTMETNRDYNKFMGKAPCTFDRAAAMPKGEFVSIEPIMDFDLNEFLQIINICKPEMVEIGADSKNNGLPEPSKEKIQQFIYELQPITKVKMKDNLKRILIK